MTYWSCCCSLKPDCCSSGALVTMASVEESMQVTCSRGVRIVADAMIADVADQAFDLIAVPVQYPYTHRQLHPPIPHLQLANSPTAHFCRLLHQPLLNKAGNFSCVSKPNAIYPGLTNLLVMMRLSTGWNGGSRPTRQL